MDNLRSLFRKMYLIRRTEMVIEDYFEKGLLRGTTHGYIGQEAIAVGVLSDINLERDFVISGHRCHGHYLALTEDVLGLVGEIMGKDVGIIHGKGASQHLHYKNFYTNGITGGMVPIAVGIGLSKKIKKEDGVVISFLGDGAMNEGYVLEALNLSVVYKTLNIFILENNSYAMSTPTSKYIGNSFEHRVKGFGISYLKMKALDVIEIQKKFQEVYRFVKERNEPFFIEFETFRFCGHSKSDKREYIDKNLEQFWLENDPLKRIEGTLKEEEVSKIKKEVDDIIDYSFKKALRAREPDPLKTLSC